MNRLFLLIFLLVYSTSAYEQNSYLFIKKGYRKVRTYYEGDRIMLRTKNGDVYSGLITHLLNTTIFINGQPVNQDSVDAVMNGKPKRDFHITGKQLLLLNAGAAMITAGLAISKQEKFKGALISGLTIAYVPLLLPFLRSKLSFRRKQFKMGKKYQLRVLDLEIPRKRGF